MRRLLVSAMVAGSCCAGVVLGSAPPAFADTTQCEGLNGVDADTEIESATEAGASFLDLQMPEAQEIVSRRLGRDAGDAVRVALIDTGAEWLEGSQDASLAPVDPEDGYQWWSGPGMAGLIAGQPQGEVPVGFAPGASLTNIRAFDVGVGGSGEDLTAPTVATLVAALGRVRPGTTLVAVPQTVVPTSDEQRQSLKKAVKRLTKKGVVLVAAAGDRPSEEGQAGYSAAGEPDPGEDHADLFWPAALAQQNRRVLAVTSTPAPDGSTQAVPSSAVSVAVPTYGAVTYTLRAGETCRVGTVSSATAAAEVTGILAMLMSYFPDETPDQVVRRMLETATGSANPDLPDVHVGAGVVQPLEALTRPLRPAKDGSLDDGAPIRASTPPAVLPEPEADRLASTREDLVRWGLAGGLALVLVLVLRPVFVRRRG